MPELDVDQPDFVCQTSLSAVFGRLLAALRADLGTSQRAFRAAAGLKPGALERLETGLAVANLGHLFKVVKALRKADPWGDARAPDGLDVTPGKLVGALSRCAALLRSRRVGVYLEGPPWDDLPELELPRLDRLIAPVVEECLAEWA